MSGNQCFGPAQTSPAWVPHGLVPGCIITLNWILFFWKQNGNDCIAEPDHQFKFYKCGGFDIELPFQVGAHLLFHLVDLPKHKHSLTDNTPGLVGVSVIADDLGSNHKC